MIVTSVIVFKELLNNKHLSFSFFNTSHASFAVDWVQFFLARGEESVQIVKPIITEWEYLREKWCARLARAVPPSSIKAAAAISARAQLRHLQVWMHAKCYLFIFAKAIEWVALVSNMVFSVCLIVALLFWVQFRSAEMFRGDADAECI